MAELINFQDFLLFTGGGIAIKIIELILRHFSKGKDQAMDYHTNVSKVEKQFRDELRKDVVRYKQEVDALREQMTSLTESLKAEIKHWREKYYEAYGLYQKERATREGYMEEIRMIKEYITSDPNQRADLADVEREISKSKSTQ